MGIFSDDDINEADQLVKKLANRMDFLRGFERSYKGFKRDGWKPNAYNPIIVDGHERYLQDGIDKDPVSFGDAMGILCALLKYHPRKVLEYPDVFIRYFRALSKHKVFYDYAVTRVKRWNNRIKKMFGELSVAEQKTYGEFLRSI